VTGIAWQGLAPDSWQFSRASLLNKGHFFALGVASSALVRGHRGGLVRYALTLAACLVLCATQGLWGKMLPPLIWTLCLTAHSRPETAGLRVLGDALRSRTARWFGAISYSLYLVNEPIHKVLADRLSDLAGGNAALFGALWLPSAVVLPVAAAAWLHYRVEIPAMRWGRLRPQAPSNVTLGVVGR
jgi:peptidoglycan/LPS O-acetylase OafA/YrhL